jgi:hypothetical protein
MSINQVWVVVDKNRLVHWTHRGWGIKLSWNFFKIFVWKGLERSEKVWKELKNYKNEYKSNLGGHRQKPIGALNSPRMGDKIELKFFQNFCLERSGKVWKKLKNDKNEYKLSLGGHRQKPIGALDSARIGEKIELKIFQNLCLERSGNVWKELKKW